MPKLDLRWLWAEPSESNGEKSEPLRLHYPLKMPQRTAIIRVKLHAEPPARYFPHLDAREMASYQPEAIAAPLGDLRLLSQLHRAGWIALHSLKFPLVVLSQPSTGMLTTAERDELWRAFELPVFEQLRDAGGRLLAAECEGHEGMHLTPQVGVAGPDIWQANLRSSWELTEVPCVCGSRIPRVVSMGNRTRAASAGR